MLITNGPAAGSTSIPNAIIRKNIIINVCEPIVIRAHLFMGMRVAARRLAGNVKLNKPSRKAANKLEMRQMADSDKPKSANAGGSIAEKAIIKLLIRTERITKIS